MALRPGIKRWLQISLRMLLAAIVVLCAGLAVWTNRARRQEALVRQVISLGGGFVSYQHELNANHKRIPDARPPGPAWLRRLMGDHYFVQLHSVACGGLNDKDLGRLAEFSTIRELRLGEGLTDEGFRHLARFPELRLLKCDSPAVTDGGLQHLANLRNLEFLSLSMARISDEGLNHLASLEKLSFLHIQWTQVTSEGVARLRARLPQLTVQPSAFASIEKEKEQVRQLIELGARFDVDKEGWIDTVYLIGPDATDKDLTVLTQIKRLAHLNLHGARITSDGIQQVLAAHPNLQVGPPFSMPADEEAEAVTALQRRGAQLWFDREGHVRIFKWWQQESPEEALANLSRMTRLQGVSIYGTHLTEAAWLHLGRLTTLETLQLVRSPAADGNLRHLKDLAQLKTLHLGGPQITDAGLAHVARLKRLTRLNLQDTRITGAGLTYLAELPEFTDLFLAGSEVQDRSLLHLSKLPHLRKLTLRLAEVTDNGLPHLGILTKLETLSLEGTSVSDAGLVHLHTMANLKTLNLEYTRATKAGVEQIKQALPKCKVQI